MLFNSSFYGVFLIGTLAAFWLIRRHRLARVLFLTLASYGFYFYGTFDSATEQDGGVPMGPWAWSALCLGIIFVGSSLDFWIGRLLGRTQSPGGRKALLLVSIVYYLGVLSLFKYFNFAADSFVDLCAALGVSVKATHVRLVLPFGISFFTFETMSYTIDVYRRELEPSKRYLDYLLFVCFFPHLVAGPIVRPHQMLPQLAETPRFNSEQQSSGLFLIAQGLVKKIVVGDMLAANLVNRVFDNPERFSSLEVLVAVYAYAFQLYANFSGYTDIALGSARLFGYELPENFNRPYIAWNLQEFWHRWHISLSTWLRDYLYKPLGGSRNGAWKTYRNLFITMLLGGLWHGASWNFVIWGALHGVALAGTRIWQRSRFGRNASDSVASRIFPAVLTFHYVCFCWIFFRAPSFAHATLMLGRIARGTTSAPNLAPNVLAVLVAAAVMHVTPKGFTERVRVWFVARPSLVQGLVLAVVAMVIHAAAGAKAEPFIYGQF